MFDKSMEALQLLNKVGYGMGNTNLQLHLVYNPSGAFLPPPQKELKEDYKRELERQYGIYFSDLFTITNMPISRYLKYLMANNKYEEYMNKLVEAFNPETISEVMCRNTISVGWDGYLFDCDFNQMLDMKIDGKIANHISNFNRLRLEKRNIKTGQHCYGCTAGAGSSCQGAIV